MRLAAIVNHQLPEKFHDLCVCSSRACRLHFGSHPNRRLRILIKILTLRLCSYINLFSCQISSYGLLPSLRRLSGYGLITGFRFDPCGFHLATFIQLKMALNNCCSPDLLNVRRQPSLWLASNIGQHLGGSSLDKPELDLDAKMVELTGIEPVTSCLQSRRSPN